MSEDKGKRDYQVLQEDDGAVDDVPTNDVPTRMDEGLSLNKIAKVNHGKPNLSTILDAPKTMKDFAAIIDGGASKDGRTLTSWLHYDDPRGLESALLRHLMAWHNGEKTDPETGLSHLSHVVANAIMLRETEND